MATEGAGSQRIGDSTEAVAAPVIREDVVESAREIAREILELKQNAMTQQRLRAASEDNLARAKREILGLKQDVETQQRLRAASEDNLARAKRKSVEDARTIAGLNTEISKLLEIRMETQRRLNHQLQLNENIERAAERAKSEIKIASARTEFLEKERQRLSAENLEASSKLSMVHSMRVRENELSRDERSKLREELLEATKRQSAAEARCNLLQEAIQSMQKHRQKERDNWAAERKHLTDLTVLHKEELIDAEKETKRYKNLVDTVAREKITTVANANDTVEVKGINSDGTEAFLKDRVRRLQIIVEKEARNVEMSRRKILQLENEKYTDEKEESRNL